MSHDYVERGVIARKISHVIAGRLRHQDLKTKARYLGKLGWSPVTFHFRVKAYNEKWFKGQEGLMPEQIDKLCEELNVLVNKKLSHVHLVDWEKKPHTQPGNDTVTHYYIYVKAVYT